jgi:hypothetical protein
MTSTGGLRLYCDGCGRRIPGNWLHFLLKDRRVLCRACGYSLTPQQHDQIHTVGKRAKIVDALERWPRRVER